MTLWVSLCSTAVYASDTPDGPAPSGAELSIPENIGIEIPQAEQSISVIGIIMWALVAVAVMTALIVIFANLGGANVSHDSVVPRKRYRKKQPQKSKLLHDKYYNRNGRK